MARDTLSIQTIGSLASPELEDVTFTAGVAANDLQFANDGDVLVLINNAGASPQDAVFSSVADPFGRTGDLTVSTANGEISIAGPFPTALWNQSDGNVYIDITTEDSFSFAAVKFLR